MSSFRRSLIKAHSPGVLAPAGSRGTLRMNEQHSRVRERERERETRPGCAAESGRFVFYCSFYTLSSTFLKGGERQAYKV